MLFPNTVSENSIPISSIKNVNLFPYINYLREKYGNEKIAARKIIMYDGSVRWLGNEEKKISRELVISNKDCYFLKGLGGRGKTTVLKKLIQFMLTDMKWIPFYISCETIENNSILQNIVQIINPLVSSISTVSAFKEWFKTANVMILIDNWDRINESRISFIEEEINQLKTEKTVIIIAGRSNTVNPDGFITLNIEKYSDTELSKIIYQHFSNDSLYVYSFFRMVPRGVFPLLREPVILSKYLELYTLSVGNKVKTPNNVLELVDILLSEKLKSRYLRIDKKVDEVTSINCYVARRCIDSFDIKVIKMAIADVGLQLLPSDFADEMISVGIWERASFGSFRFFDDVWRIHFKVKSIFNEGSSELKIDSFNEWLNSNITDFLIAVPFIIALEKDLRIQDRLIEILLEKSIEHYFIALSARRCEEQASSFDRMYFFQELIRFYLKLIDIYFPELKNFLDPWVCCDGNENLRNEKIIVSGKLEPHALFYYFGFAASSYPDIILASEEDLQASYKGSYRFAPKKGCIGRYLHMLPLGLDHTSAGFVCANNILDQIEALIKGGKFLDCEWFAREKMRQWVKLMSPLFQKIDWEKLTIEQVMNWVNENYFFPQDDEKESDLSAAKQDSIIGVGDKSISISELSKIGEFLINKGFITVKDLGLPGPDLNLPNAKNFRETYSVEQIINRTTAFYDAIILTYKYICENFFGRINSHFLYASFPCRYSIEICSPTNIAEEIYWCNSLEPVQDWQDVHTKVKIVEKATSPDHLAELYEQKYRSYGRNFRKIPIGAMLGRWDPWECVVTETVIAMLVEDISYLKQLLKPESLGAPIMNRELLGC